MPVFPVDFLIKKSAVPNKIASTNKNIKTLRITYNSSIKGLYTPSLLGRIKHMPKKILFVEDDEGFFNIYRSFDGVNFALVGTVAKNVTSFTDSRLFPNTTYYYYVLAGINNLPSTPILTAVPVAPSQNGDENIGSSVSCLRAPSFFFKICSRQGQVLKGVRDFGQREGPQLII